MGISIQTAKLLFREALRKPFYGSVLQLGRQDIYFDKTKLLDSIKEADQGSVNLTVSGMNAPIDDVVFFHTLGFDEI